MVDLAKALRFRTDLILKLAEMADGDCLTVAGILGIGPRGARAMLQRRRTRPRWNAFRSRFRSRESRASQLRRWWRWRLRQVGIEPAELSPDDPLWRACYRLPRGALVRAVAAEMRAERPGESLATNDRLVELIDRVTALAAPLAPPTPPKPRARRRHRK